MTAAPTPAWTCWLQRQADSIWEYGRQRRRRLYKRNPARLEVNIVTMEPGPFDYLDYLLQPFMVSLSNHGIFFRQAQDERNGSILVTIERLWDLVVTGRN